MNQCDWCGGTISPSLNWASNLPLRSVAAITIDTINNAVMTGKAPNQRVSHHFKAIEPYPGAKKQRQQCVHCLWNCSENMTRQLEHLAGCEAFQRPHRAANQSSITTSTPIVITPQRRKALDVQLAKAIFTTGRPFKYKRAVTQVEDV
jgi:hypothetical protein